MAKSATGAEMFANRALVSMTMSAANTLTYSQVRFTTGLVEKIALVVHRIDWIPTSASLKEIVASTDLAQLALTLSSSPTSLSPSDQRVIAMMEIVGIGVAVERYITPLTMDFSMFPGGGIIIPPNPIYLAMSTSGAAGASGFNACIWFSYRQLSDADYLELIQTLLPQNI